MAEKKWYTSKTLWVNIIFLIAFLSKGALGFEITAEETAAMLILVNLVLRAVTKTKLEW